MPQFRKKPVVVEAVKLTDEALDAEHPSELHIPGVGYDPVHREALVTTIHGDKLFVHVGEWIITEPDGKHHYPCKPDIFEATYEPVAQPDPAQELRDAVIEFTKASDAHHVPPGDKQPGATGNYIRASTALLRLGRRLVGMEDS